MSTPYSDIYNLFLSKINSYDFATLTLGELEDELHDYLLVATTNFTECEKLSNRNETLKRFEEDLSLTEQDILATLIIVEYLSPKVLTDELIIHALSDKDIKMTSQANHLLALEKIKSNTVREANVKINKYKLKKGLDSFYDNKK